MKLSNDAIEALILIGGFALVAVLGLIVFLVWPTNIYGNWRVFLTLFAGAIIVIPTMIALRKRLTDRAGGNGR